MSDDSVVIMHISHKEGQYFFSTDHCQKHTAPDTYPSGDHWVPVTYHIPQHVVSRPTLPSGLITCREELVNVFYSDLTEIPNPAPGYQA